MIKTTRECSFSTWTAASIVLFFAAATLPSTRGQAPAKLVPEVTEAEYQVLSAYIAGTFIGDEGEDRVAHRVSKIVIINVTQSDQRDSQVVNDSDKPVPWEKMRKYFRKEAPTLQPATVEAFHAIRTQSAPFHPSFHLPVPYELVDAREIDSILKGGGWWTDYYKKYPGSQGVLALSRVGFNPEGKQAFFYASNSCDGKCGTGSFIVMEKGDSNWKIVKEILIWIS